jgi:hypothetical protein
VKVALGRASRQNSLGRFEISNVIETHEHKGELKEW